MATATPLVPPPAATAIWPADRARPHSSLRPALDLRRITRDALLIAALLLINKPGNAGAAFFFAILTGMVLWSPQAAFKALALCWLGLMINPAFVPKSLVWTPARLALPLLAFVRFSVDMSRIGTSLFATSYYFFFVCYVLAMAACSLISGWYTEIALVKLANFWAVMSAIFAGITVLRRLQIDMTEWFVSLISATTLLALTAVALGVDERDGGMFLGAFLHSNCHSLYGPQFVVFLVSVLLLGNYPKRSITLPLVAIWAILMFWSKARASIAATIVGVVVLLMLARPIRNRFGFQLRINIPRSRLIAGALLSFALLVLCDVLTSGAISRSGIAFINKEGKEAELTELDPEQVLASREGLITLSWNNFLEHPLTGIGFQVGTDEKFIKNVTWLTAPTEKGFLITAVLEEGGVLGSFTFLMFLLSFANALFAKRNVPALTMLATFVTSNMAEVTMFSPGAAGAFGWAMIGAATILGDHCWRYSPAPIAARPVSTPTASPKR